MERCARRIHLFR